MDSLLFKIPPVLIPAKANANNVINAGHHNKELSQLACMGSITRGVTLQRNIRDCLKSKSTKPD